MVPSSSLRSIVLIISTISLLLCSTTLAFLPSSISSTTTATTTSNNKNIVTTVAPSINSGGRTSNNIRRWTTTTPSHRHPRCILSSSITASSLSASNVASEVETETSSSSSVDLLSSTLEEVEEEEKNQLLQNLLNNINKDDGEEFTPVQMVINAVFLTVSFGYVLYTILNIDQGMTRGWTGSEIAMRVPLDNWGAYESYLANKPIMTKTLINVIIYLLGDWLSQTAFQQKNLLHFDISRTLRNGFIGLCFGPIVHEYYQFSDTILPPEDGLIVRLQKILMDQTIYLGVKCSVYISAVGLLSGDDWETVQQNVKDKIGNVMITAWKFWPLVHCITYGLIPARHRVLWVNSVDLVWNAILASMSQKEEEEVVVAVATSSSTEAGVASLVEESEQKKQQQPIFVLDNNKAVLEERNVDILILSNEDNNKPTNTTLDGAAAANIVAA